MPRPAVRLLLLLCAAARVAVAPSHKWVLDPTSTGAKGHPSPVPPEKHPASAGPAAHGKGQVYHDDDDTSKPWIKQQHEYEARQAVRAAKAKWTDTPPPPPDPCPLAGFEEEFRTIYGTCCPHCSGVNEDHLTPSVCSSACAAIYLPFMKRCYARVSGADAHEKMRGLESVEFFHECATTGRSHAPTFAGVKHRNIIGGIKNWLFGSKEVAEEDPNTGAHLHVGDTYTDPPAQSIIEAALENPEDNHGALRKVDQ